MNHPRAKHMSDQARVVWALGERIKELTALHGTARVLEDPRTPPDRVLAAVTPDFVRTSWCQTAFFRAAGQRHRLSGPDSPIPSSIAFGSPF
jgi:hypothetical protein